LPKAAIPKLFSAREEFMRSRVIIAAIAACTFVLPALADMSTTPYAGQQTRSIKALSDDDIVALREGTGMGMALAAELNGYPGPAHVLELADKLKLTEDQLRQVTVIHDHMSAAAKPLGADLISREETLDQQFAKGDITPERLAAETVEIGELHGRLRAIHLSAHLETRALLTPEQIALYEQLRGYAEPALPAHHHQQHG
jgi:Spy/CpxP family protein refolding chaperone